MNSETTDRFMRALTALVDERVRVALERPADDVVNDATPGLPVSARKARQLAKEGAFPATKRGRRWFFRRADLVAHLTSAPLARGASKAPDPVDELAASLGLAIGGAR